MGLKPLHLLIGCLFADGGLMFRHRLSYRLVCMTCVGCSDQNASFADLLSPTLFPKTLNLQLLALRTTKAHNSLQGTSPAWEVKRTERIVPRGLCGGGGLLGWAGRESQVNALSVRPRSEANMSCCMSVLCACILSAFQSRQFSSHMSACPFSWPFA